MTDAVAPENAVNVVSVSGGKDSTAMMTLAVERGVDCERVFADTGHEHPLTYEYVDYLRERIGPIRTIKADFSERLAKRRETIKEKWPLDLVSGKAGRWVVHPRVAREMHQREMTSDMDALLSYVDALPLKPAAPSNPYESHKTEFYHWEPARRPVSEATAHAVVEKALAVMHPTGNPFLDLCLLKGRFPSTKARFCTEELKFLPIYHQVHKPIVDAGGVVWSWQGVRRDESKSRARLQECEEHMEGMVAYRPILDWSVADVFEQHRKHGIKPNPLYKEGMGRVGCMPCIHARKGELAEIVRRYPGMIERVRAYEALVNEASKRGMATFFAADKIPGVGDSRATIDAVAAWAMGRGEGSLFDADDGGGCRSLYGLCE